MAYVPLTKPPETITQGEALSWKVSFADYPPASWTLTYYAAGYGLTPLIPGDGWASRGSA